MGYGKYSLEDRTTRANTLGYATKSAQEIFVERNINKEMNPNGVSIRESRDSDEHPESVSIIIGLDVTGSMGRVPHHLVKEGLPHMMSDIMDKGINDPQILFLAIGDHKYDKAPLQVGQYESSDELMDKWLTSVYLEGGGGGNHGESYFLAWYFAAYHTSIDCFEKRNKKGYLITIGDEPYHKTISSKQLKDIMGNKPNPIDPFNEEEWDDDEVNDTITAKSLFEKAKEKYDIYHIHIHQTKEGKKESTVEEWYELLGDNLFVADNKEDVPGIISNIVCNGQEEKIKWYTKSTFDTPTEIIL